MSALSDRAEIENLYRDVVMDHYRHPRHRERLPRPDASALLHNPVCGDQVEVEVLLEGPRVAQVSARARGCSIVVAAGSVMSELVGGLDSAGVRKLVERLSQLLHGSDTDPDVDPRLRAFARVAQLPGRTRCATLPWEALEEALGKAGAG